MISGGVLDRAPRAGTRRVRDLCAVALVVVLGGCAIGGGGPPPTPATAADVEARDQRLRALDTFRVSGRFGYRDERQNLSAGIEWDRSAEDLAIRLRAPLGLGRMEITQDATGARLVRGHREPVIGPNAAEVLRTGLGLGAPVPLDEIGDWIRGLAGPRATSVQRDAGGRLQSLVYRDATGQRWRATIRRYRQVEGEWLPALLSAVSGERHLRLALSEWRLGADATGATSDRVPDQAAPDAAPDPAPGPAPGPASGPASRRLTLPGA